MKKTNPQAARQKMNPLPAGTVQAAPTAHSPAFSLVEIMLALGIFSFCVVGIVYLLGSALSTSRDSGKDTALATALHTVDTNMRSMGSGTLSAVALASGTGTNFFFDEFGNALTSGTYKTLYYIANVTAVPSTAVSGTMGFSAYPAAQVTDSQNRQYLWKVVFYYPSVGNGTATYHYGKFTTQMLLGQSSYDSLP